MEKIKTIFGTITIDRNSTINIGDIVWDGRTNPQEPDYPFYKVEEEDDIPNSNNLTDVKVIESDFKILL